MNHKDQKLYDKLQIIKPNIQQYKAEIEECLRLGKSAQLLSAVELKKMDSRLADIFAIEQRVLEIEQKKGWLDFVNQLDEDITPQEIIDQLKIHINKIKSEVNTITDLDLLNYLRRNTLRTLSNYFNTYKNKLSKEDQNIFAGEIEICTGLIDDKEEILSRDEFEREIEPIITQLDSRRNNASTLEDIEELKNDLRDLKRKFGVYSDNPKFVNTDWVRLAELQLGDLEEDIRKKAVEINETVPERGLDLRPIQFPWTLEVHKRDIEKKEARIMKIIHRLVLELQLDENRELIEEELNISLEDVPNEEISKRRKKRLVKKLNKKLNKLEIIRHDSVSLIDRQVLPISLIFSEKELTIKDSDKGKISYWGIKNVILPSNYATNNDAGLSYNLQYNIVEERFSDTVEITGNFRREAALQYRLDFEKALDAIGDFVTTTSPNPNWPEMIGDLLKDLSDVVIEDQADAEDEILSWRLSISTNPLNTDDVSITITPTTDQKLFGDKSFKKIPIVGKNTSYKINLEEGNKLCLSEISKKLGININ